MNDLTVLSFSGLESGLWTSHISTDINPVLADAIQPTYPVSLSGMSSSLAMTNSSSKAWGGGLLAHNIDFDSIMQELPYTQFLYTGFIPGFCFQLLARFETDLTIAPIAAPVSTAIQNSIIQNKVNMAMQYNFDTKDWQLTDQNGAWQNTGVFGVISPDTPFNVVQKGFVDYANKKFQVLSINGSKPTTPSFVSPLNWYSSNWASTVNLQLQTEVYNPGALTSFYRAIQVQFSNQPF